MSHTFIHSELTLSQEELQDNE